LKREPDARPWPTMPEFALSKAMVLLELPHPIKIPGDFCYSACGTEPNSTVCSP